MSLLGNTLTFDRYRRAKQVILGGRPKTPKPHNVRYVGQNKREYSINLKLKMSKYFSSYVPDQVMNMVTKIKEATIDMGP